MKFFFIWCLCFAAPLLLVGQQKYTQADKVQFVDTYMSLKKLDTNKPAALDSLLQAYNITAERYQTLLIAAIRKKETSYSENERSFREAVSQLNIRDTNTATSAILKEGDNSVELYYDMLHRYKTDIGFQHELRPLFLAYFKDNK